MASSLLKYVVAVCNLAILSGVGVRFCLTDKPPQGDDASVTQLSPEEADTLGKALCVQKDGRTIGGAGLTITGAGEMNTFEDCRKAAFVAHEEATGVAFNGQGTKVCKAFKKKVAVKAGTTGQDFACTLKMKTEEGKFSGELTEAGKADSLEKCALSALKKSEESKVVSWETESKTCSYATTIQGGSIAAEDGVQSAYVTPGLSVTMAPPKQGGSAAVSGTSMLVLVFGLYSMAAAVQA